MTVRAEIETGGPDNQQSRHDARGRALGWSARSVSRVPATKNGTTTRFQIMHMDIKFRESSHDSFRLRPRPHARRAVAADDRRRQGATGRSRVRPRKRDRSPDRRRRGPGLSPDTAPRPTRASRNPRRAEASTTCTQHPRDATSKAIQERRRPRPEPATPAPLTSSTYLFEPARPQAGRAAAASRLASHRRCATLC